MADLNAPMAVPLTELLRSIPKDARLIIEDDWKSSTVWPVGLLANKAADEIDRLLKVEENAGLMRAGLRSLMRAYDKGVS